MKRKKIQPQDIEARYFDRIEAAKYLRTTPGVISVLASQGRLPAIRLRGPKGACRKLLFDREDLDCLLQGAKSDQPKKVET